METRLAIAQTYNVLHTGHIVDEELLDLSLRKACRYGFELLWRLWDLHVAGQQFCNESAPALNMDRQSARTPECNENAFERI